MPTLDANVTCKLCSNAIVSIGNRRYCSACLSRKCGICGNAFTVRQVTQTSKFCSRGCYAQSKKGKPAPNVGKKIVASKPCEVCGLPVNGQPALVARRKFCSARCFGVGTAGDKNVNWRGGVDQRVRQFGSAARASWRLAVLVRDNGRCRWCDSEGVRTYANLEIHHIIPFSSNPELVVTEANSITLCRKHHVLTLGRENEIAEFLAKLLGEPLMASPSPNRKDKTPFVIGKEELQDLYHSKELGTNEIGRLFGVTGACVLKRMRFHGINRRSLSEARAKAKRHSTKGIPTGSTPWNKGKIGVYSEETLAKIREAREHQVFSEESKERRSASVRLFYANNPDVLAGRVPWNKGLLKEKGAA